MSNSDFAFAIGNAWLMTGMLTHHFVGAMICIGLGVAWLIASAFVAGRQS